MSLYIKKSEEVISIYLDFISKEDLHIYSIDECFLDVTHYLKLYNMTDYELAEKILKTIEEKTGLTATCGVGPNLLLAKVAMDTEAKRYKNGIAKWTYADVESKLWNIYPLSEMWGIGKRMEYNLNKMNINMKTEEMMVYEAPQVSVIEVEVEKGFAASEPALSDFGYGGDLSGN